MAPATALAATAAHLSVTVFSAKSMAAYQRRRDARAAAAQYDASQAAAADDDDARHTRHDASNERIVLALVALFVERPDSLTGFQMLVPGIFETYLVCLLDDALMTP